MAWTKKVIFWAWPQMSGLGIQQHQHRVVSSKKHLRLYPHMDQPTEPLSSVWTLAGKCHLERAERVSWHSVFLFVAQQHPCWIQSFPPWSNSLPCLSWVTALPLWHNSSIWFHLTGAMNNLTGGIIIPASSTSLAITRSLGSAISVAG